MDSPKFKLYLSNGDKKKTVTEAKPKLTADANDFVAAGNALQTGYGLKLIEVSLQSETSVYTAA